MSLVVNKTAARDLLNTIRDQVLDTAVLHLYTGSTIPTPEDVAAAFSEADYSGYNAVSLTSWGNVYTNADGVAEVAHASRQFDHDDGETGNVVTGYYITDASGDLIVAEKFATGQEMEAEGDSIIVVPKFSLG